jgi:hypothetical protein
MLKGPACIFQEKKAAAPSGASNSRWAAFDVIRRPFEAAGVEFDEKWRWRGCEAPQRQTLIVRNNGSSQTACESERKTWARRRDCLSVWRNSGYIKPVLVGSAPAAEAL